MLPTAALFFVLIVAIIVTAAIGWSVAAAYRRRMLALMRAHAPAGERSAVGPGARNEADAAPRKISVDLVANRRATKRLLATLTTVSLLIALTQSGLALFFVYPAANFRIDRLLVLGAVYAWPIVLVWGLALRWSWLRVLAGVALYLALMLALVVARSTPGQTIASVSGWLFSSVAVPLTMTLLIGASGRIRAVAPYLLPPVLLLVGASVTALQLLAPDAETISPWLSALAEAIGAVPALFFAVVAPWLILAWPVAIFGREVAAAYRAKRFSDLAYLCATYWFLILFTSALPASQNVGAQAWFELLAWLWIPAAHFGLRAYLRPPPRPATLLVLRVFKRDEEVERLFDRVVERWRLTGNTVLIAGTDVISRTLSADDLLTYFGGALAGRFVATPAELAGRIAAFDWRPDPDGRYRINDCYCHDASWQAALRALVARADVVLMDLRGFRPENAGCRYELGVLAAARHLARIVVVHDEKTALELARAEAGESERFAWLAAERMNNATAGRVLAALFDVVG
jgi:hypothetical protein